MMKPLMLAVSLLMLAGCAGTADRAARMESPAHPGAHATERAAAHATPAVVQSAQVALPVTAATQGARADAMPSEPDGWAQLNRRVIAWGDPMRRSMEQYCSTQVATYKP